MAGSARSRTHTGMRGGRLRWLVAVLGLVASTLSVAAVVVSPAPVQALGDGGLSLISTGASHTCGVTAAGAAKCWGSNSIGQLGNNSLTSSAAPVQVQGLTSGVTAISAGQTSTCAVVSGAVKCWGSNSNGQLGTSGSYSLVPVSVSGLSSGVTAISVGNAYACAVQDGAAKCWGANNGRLGDGTSADATAPVQVSGLTSGVTGISAGNAHTCAVVSDSARCWGTNGSGQLGDDSTTSSLTPVAVVGLGAGVSSISAGGNHSCAVVSGGAKCWGSNSHGQLGNNSKTQSTVPVDVSGLCSGATVAAAGFNHSCALVSSAALCWGRNTPGFLLGNNSDASSAFVPVAVTGLSEGVTALSAGSGGGVGHTCAVVSGDARCWGGNNVGQRGDGVGGTAVAPAAVSGISSGLTSVDAGSAHSCGVVAGAARCWGSGTSGQLGNGTTISSTVPVPVSGLTSGVSAVAAGGNNTCAIVSGSVWCWGRNLYGVAGPSGIGSSKTTPALIGGLTGVTGISVGDDHACAIDSGAAYCWGRNSIGQLGVGTTSNTSTPIPVAVQGLGSGVTAISAGAFQTCAVVSGSARCWGRGGEGQLGRGSTTASSVPVQVTGLTSGVTAISAGSTHSCAVMFGSVRCWGAGGNGQLGNGAQTDALSPVQASATSSVTSISTGTRFSCAVRSGSVLCWGDNTDGRLGTGQTAGLVLTPQFVTGFATGASAVAAGGTHTCAVVSGSGRCWGANDLGQIGATDLQVPNEVVGGFTWSSGSLEAPTISGSRSPAANAAGWNNEPVTVSFTCSSTALASCTSPVTVSTDGADQSVTGTVTDAASQSASATVSGISIDRVAPTLAGLASSAPNAAGWYAAPVSMAWTCDDALSGIAGGACPAPSSTVGEGSAVSVSGSVLDKAGNQTTASSESVKVDLTKPSTGVSSPPTWSSSDVTLTLLPTDALSGVASTSFRVDAGPVQSGTAPVVSGQGIHSVEFWSADVAGNVESAQTVQVRIDVQAPSIRASVTPAANAAGWNNVPVAVTFDCGDEDGGSGVVSCTAPQSFTDEVDTTVTGTVSDGAGNTASVQQPVRIDKTAPVVTADVPPAPRGSNGWFNQPVQVPFTCADAGGSGIATCPEPVVIAGDGADQPVTGEAVDAAGNTGSASGATVSLDQVLPTITGASVAPANGDGSYDGTVTVRWTCDDALSGVVACPADEQVSGEGVHVVSGSVSDRAGNTATGEVTIRINRDTSQDPGTIHGTLIDQSTGLPAAGVQIGLFLPSNLAQVAVTKTGTDGRWVFPVVDDGTYKLAATKWGTYLQRWYPAATDGGRSTAITVSKGTNITADMAISPGHVVKGTVTGAGSVPVGGATVVLSNGTQAKTNAAGGYEIKGVASAAYTVKMIAVGHVTGTASVALSGATSTTTVIDRQLVAQPASTGMKGTVTSLSPGGPLAGATVRIWAKDAMTFSITVTTGANGRFELPSLPAGDYQVDVVRYDYAVRWAADSADRTGAATISLTAGCTPTPDTSWGSPCATSVNIRMRKPGT